MLWLLRLAPRPSLAPVRVPAHFNTRNRMPAYESSEEEFSSEGEEEVSDEVRGAMHAGVSAALLPRYGAMVAVEAAGTSLRHRTGKAGAPPAQ